MELKRFIIILFNIIFFINYSLFAEGDIFVDKYNARAIGMGNNFVAVSDDSSSVFYNPSGLGQLESCSFNSMYADLYSTGIVKNFILSGAGKYKDIITLGGGWCGELIDLEPEDWFQHRIYVSFAYFIFDKIYIGMNVKLFLISTDLREDDNIWGWGLDFGILTSSKNWEMDFLNDNNLEIKIGFVLNNIYSKLKWSKQYEEKVPYNVVMAFNLIYNDIINAGVQLNSYKEEIIGFSVGQELYLLKLLDAQFDEKYKVSEIILRAGVSFENLYQNSVSYSCGIGLAFNNYSFHYAVLYQADYFSPTHYFSLNVSDWSL